MKRLKLSTLRLVREENQILGNFTSVRGEYYIPQIGKTGFYKMNGCMVGAREDEDLRELFSARIMDKIGFPHADVILVSDRKNGDGCLSVNILGENEHFIEPEEPENNPIYNIEDFIESDLKDISKIPGITSEDLRKRKEYLLKYLFVSALICNTDIKMDNMFIIKNSQTGEFRNSEYYDMGISFIESKNRRFFCKFSANEIIEQLYELYPSQIVPFGKTIQEKLSENDIKQILGESYFKGFSRETRESINRQLLDRINIIKSLNSKEKNNFLYGIDNLHEVSKEADLSLRDRAKNVLSRLKEMIRGREGVDNI